ncbi:MAG: DUF3829 domain-containing protein [Hyphomicrobium sp.]
MRAFWSGQKPHCLTGLRLLAASLGALMLSLQSAAAEDIQAVLQKANAYIEVAKMTERAVESWERYGSWVNMKTGPTGKERYIDYGMYDLYDVAALLVQARAAAGAAPGIQKLDAALTRYLDAYDALAPAMNQASAYYERKGYEADKAREGQTLHKTMVPLATTFLAEREVVMAELRPFIRDVEGLELAAMEAREGRTAAWQVGHVLHTANRVVDVFPRNRPQQMSGEALDEAMAALGPQSTGEEFDQVIAGVEPAKNVIIDVQRYNEALEKYAAAVGEFDRFSGEKPDDFDEFKPLPRQLLGVLRAFQAPLKKSQGRDFKGGPQMAGQIAQVYFEMFNTGNGMWGSQLRFLP